MNQKEYQNRIIEEHAETAIKTGCPAKYMAKLGIYVSERIKKDKLSEDSSQFLYETINLIRKKISTITNGKK